MFKLQFIKMCNLKRRAKMNMYEELARLQHYGREDIVQDLEQHLRCWYCEKVRVSTV